MKTARTVRGLRDHLNEGRPDGFVPTLGALHDGHRSLLRAARADGGLVAGSIFVNPLQFGPREDFASYPRTEESDLELFEQEGVDIAFLPSAHEMYPPGATTRISVGRLGEVLEGAHRPGHFEGVATVCAKLFNVMGPRRAYFGQKDAQQIAVLKRMVADLNFDIEIVVCPTVRAPDGLALSSRNAYLSTDERGQATAIHRSLAAGESILEGDGNPEAAELEMKSMLEKAPGVSLDYAVARDPDTFEAPVQGRPVLLAVAARVGPARLIDNVVWGESRETGGGVGEPVSETGRVGFPHFRRAKSP